MEGSNEFVQKRNYDGYWDTFLVDRGWCQNLQRLLSQIESISLRKLEETMEIPPPVQRNRETDKSIDPDNTHVGI